MTDLFDETAIKGKVEEKLEELKEKINDLFLGQVNIPEFGITFDIDHTTHLACVKYEYCGSFMGAEPTLVGIEMQLNPYLVDEFGDKYIDNVIPHEFAHIIVNEFISPTRQREINFDQHGHEFKLICEQLGYGHVGTSHTDMFARSEYLTARTINDQPYFEYKCACKNHKVSTKNHFKMKQGGECKCKRCGSPLTKI